MMLTAISEREALILRREIVMFHTGHQIQRDAIDIIGQCLDVSSDEALDLLNRYEQPGELMDALHLEVYPNDPNSPEEQALAKRMAQEDWQTLEVAGLVALGFITFSAGCIWLGYWIGS